MSNPVVDTGKIISPDLTAWQRNRQFDIKSDINCIGIGTVKAFDSAKQTVDISINYLRVIKGGLSSNNLNEDTVSDKTIPYPVLVKCPLMINSGGGAYITFPVKSGDTCIVLFNDRDMDTWWSTGSTGSAPNSARLHDLSDGIAIVGIRNVTNAIQSYNSNAIQILYGLSQINVQQNGVQIMVNSVTLRFAIDTLMTALITWVDTNGDTPNPATIAALQAAKLLLDGILV